MSALTGLKDDHNNPIYGESVMYGVLSSIISLLELKVSISDDSILANVFSSYCLKYISKKNRVYTLANRFLSLINDIIQECLASNTSSNNTESHFKERNYV